MNPHQWTDVTPYDLDLWHRTLRDFVPPAAFDAHAHLYQVADLGTPAPALPAAGPEVVGRSVYQDRVSSWMPDRVPTGGLFFPLPTRPLNVPAANDFVAAELRHDPKSRGLMIVTPGDDAGDVQRQLDEHRFAGFKVYHLFAGASHTQLLPPQRYIPDWAWELADSRGLVIMLHLVMPRALAAAENQRYIRDHCQRYRNATLILAHAGRGFCSHHTVAGIAPLRGLQNLYFDTSAICEPAALEAVLKWFGPTRLLFGTDFCVTEMRSRCVNLGDGFLWLDEIDADFTKSAHGRPTLLGIESLLALQQACRHQHLTDGDLEEIFCLSARRLLGLPLPGAVPDVQQLYAEARQIIPGGTQLLSKRPEMFAPQQWPAYYREARGCEVIDVAGNCYIDMSLGGILSCILGYADPDVNAAVIRRVNLGSMTTLQTTDEVDLSKLLLQLHPWAGGVRLTRSGGEAMAVAVRIARAFTGRDKVALCGYHGWHDWYLAANLSSENGCLDDPLAAHLLPGLDPAGVPRGLSGTALTFRYNDVDAFTGLIARHGPELAAVVMEPTRHTDPAPGFLETVRRHCDRLQVPLIFDEISIGWRLCLGGAHLKLGVPPDLAVFAKALGNGFPIAAIVGRGDVMQAAQSSFISSTFWTDGVGPAAAVACLRKMMRENVPAHLHHIGGQLIAGWLRLAAIHQVPIQLEGRPELALLKFAHPEADALTTLLTVRMLARGFLAGGAFNAMLAHQQRHVDDYLAALDEVFAELAVAIARGDIVQRIGGPVKHQGFTRLT